MFQATPKNAAFVILFVLLFASCHAFDLVNSANCFSLDLYKKMSTGQDNVISSPFSVDVVMSMLLAGAGGSTADQLKKGLGVGDTPFSEVENDFKTKLEELSRVNPNITLSIANSIWIQQNFNVTPAFIKSVENNFNAKEKSVDFLNDAQKATDDINSWVKTETRGLITKLFDRKLDASTVMVFINAIYFKGVWKYKFNKNQSHKETFYNWNSGAKIVFMNQRARFIYHYDDDLKAEILEMDYEGGDVSMQIILPPNGTKIEDFENTLKCSLFADAIESGHNYLVDVTVPTFQVSSDFDLEPILQASGIKDIFSGRANLTGISPGISVSKVIQKAVVKVYEEGSEAAAVTGVAIMRTAMVGAPQPEVILFRADHPFLFLIKHKPTKLILFMGRIKHLPS